MCLRFIDTSSHINHPYHAWHEQVPLVDATVIFLFFCLSQPIPFLSPKNTHSQIFKVCIFSLNCSPFSYICVYKNITFCVILNVYRFLFATNFTFLISYHCSIMSLKSAHDSIYRFNSLLCIILRAYCIFHALFFTRRTLGCLQFFACINSTSRRYFIFVKAA